VLNEKCMCWCFIHYWIEKCTVKHWNSLFMSTALFRKYIFGGILGNISNMSSKGSLCVIENNFMMAYNVCLKHYSTHNTSNETNMQFNWSSDCLFRLSTNTTQVRSVWCDFDRASSLIRGNKMPTRCNRDL